MSRLSVFAAAAVLSTLATTPVAFAKEHHHVRRGPQYISTGRPNQGYAIPGFAYAGPRLPVHDDTPSYDDPSKFGGDEALPVTH
ncbi:hypothetical protein [Bradyrhizobium elkanii]|uniref:hypothetical protein n=1 Tax=Bradyrhizobium elkanii TaxID=29448 RepID=UPI0003F83E4E|nr:hypothetical protein [Bradyrhizobium elkanii]